MGLQPIWRPIKAKNKTLKEITNTLEARVVSLGPSKSGPKGDWATRNMELINGIWGGPN